MLLGINPNYAKVWIKKGFIHGELESLTEAIKCYDNASQINSNYEMYDEVVSFDGTLLDNIVNKRW